MKKFLLGAVCALTVSSTSFAQMYGNDKGNGGDAVMINNEMVMRDFVARSNLTLIPNSLAFVKSVPDFQALITEIGKVNSKFALTIVSQLGFAKIYNSRTSLDVLPPSTTAIGGPRAEVQLAIRWGNDIVLAPEFKNFKEKSYLLVHEALHGVNDEGGALHHERVRAVVNYLKTNRGQYTRESLLEVLTDTALGESDDLRSQVALDKAIPAPIRCSALARNFGESVRSFLDIECPRWGFVHEAVRDYIPTQIDFSYLGDRKVYFNLYAQYRSKDIETVSAISLPDTGFFARAEVRNQQYECRSNRYDIGSEMRDAQETELTIRVLQDVAKFLKRSDVPVNLKKLVQEFLEDESEGRTLASAAKNAQTDLAKYAKNKAIRLANQKRCIAKFGSEIAE